MSNANSIAPGTAQTGNVVPLRPAGAVAVSFSVVESASVATKHFALDANGNLEKTPSAPLYRGTVDRVSLTGTPLSILNDLARRLAAFSLRNCLIPAPPSRTGDSFQLRTKAEASDDCDVISRTAQEFPPADGPALFAMDFDTGEFPRDLTERIKQAGNISHALANTHPPFASAAFLLRPSTSSSICNGAVPLTGQAGHHRFYVVNDGRQIAAFVDLLADRLMLNGFMWGKITETGAVLPRTLFDVAASRDSSRIFYEADAVLKSPLQYAPAARDSRVTDGLILDITSLPPLTETERQTLATMQAKLRSDLEPQAEAQRERWRNRRIKELRKRGVSEEAARKSVTGAVERRELTGDFDVQLDEGGSVTVREILADPRRFDGKTTADPLEPEYHGGTNLAVIRADGRHVTIYSHAHGGILYPLIPAPEDFFDVIDDGPEPDAKPEASDRGLSWIDPTAWEGQEVPPREWVVRGWIPKGEVTLLYGDGGVGKTLVAQQLATAAAVGRDWLGQKTTPSRVMCFFCEDSANELHRRQRDLAAALGVDLSSLSGLRLVSRSNEDNLLAVWDRASGTMKRTALFAELCADAKAFRADLVIIDTIADTFGGSEIDRSQVNGYVKGCLGRLAHEIGGSVIALGHPSRAGRQTGEGSSGSTGWNNAVRSRLYLEHVKGDPASPMRVLSSKKSNYGARGAELKLRWVKGHFDVLAGTVPAVDGETQGAPFAAVTDAVESAILLVLADRPSERLSLAKNSPYFAPRFIARVGGQAVSAFSQEELEAGIHRMIAAGKLREGVVGKDASSRPFLGLVPLWDKLSESEPAGASIFS